MNTTPYTVRQARPEEISQVLDTLTEAFLNDPYMCKVLGEKPQADKLRHVLKSSSKAPICLADV